MMDKLTDEIAEFIAGTVAAMGLSLATTVNDHRDGPRVDLDGEDGEVLLRRKGEALQALQHVTNTVFRHRLPDDARVIVDCLGFRKDKEAELRQMARYLSERARQTGLDQELGPLNPYDRRIVHMTVAEDATVASHSVGDAFMKTVIISPRKR
jgi:spoIIIJ-associated protein